MRHVNTCSEQVALEFASQKLMPFYYTNNINNKKQPNLPTFAYGFEMLSGHQDAQIGSIGMFVGKRAVRFCEGCTAIKEAQYKLEGRRHLQ